MAGAALKLYVHKLIYRISYFLFGVALGQGECRGSAAACILSSCRLSAQPDYAAYKVNSDHSRRGKGGKKSNNFGLLCCSLLIVTEEAAEAALPKQIQIKNHAKWTSSWQLSFKCTLLIRRVGPRPTQLDTNAANFRVSLSLDFSRLALLFNSRRNLQQKKKKKQKKKRQLDR